MPDGYKCDKCGASVGEADTKCPKCGDAFDEVVEPKNPKCQYCGASIREGDFLCSKCGRPLKDGFGGPSLSGIGLMAVGGFIYLVAFIYSAMSPQPGSTVEELSRQLDDARMMAIIGAAGMVVFMFGSFLQCLSLFMAVKSLQPKK